MPSPNDKSREDQALNALIAAALRHDGGDEITWDQLQQDAAHLTEEDRKELGSLPSDLVSRLLGGEQFNSKRSDENADAADADADELLATAMNRNGDDSDLTDKAREEIERRIREATQHPPENSETPEKDDLDGRVD